MDREITWSNQAWLDLEEIADYISRDSEAYAANVVSEIRDATDLLSSFPEQGRIVPEIDNPSIRELFVANYRLIYRLREQKIEIVTIVHTARDLNKVWDDM